jgi:outer membrane protein assembly factor BamB
MKARIFCLLVVLLGTALAATADDTPQEQGWPQWGQNPQHTGSAANVGQLAASGRGAARILAEVVYDPFTTQEENDPSSNGGLLVHYQTPLIDGNAVYMEFKSGTFTSMATWETQIWNEERLDWQNGSLVQTWAFESDWKPIPHGTPTLGPTYEPVFHAAVAGDFVYVPGFGGSVYKLSKRDGSQVAHIQPFGATVDPNIFLSGPITVDAQGNVYFVAIQLAPANPWTVDAVNSWLVKVDAAEQIRTATFASLTHGAPSATDLCPGTFNLINAPLPWPPTPDAVAPTIPCGSQRAAMNSAPAIGPDGTIYVGSLAHLVNRVAYLLAVDPELKPKWKASLLERFHDGCNVLLPPNGTLGGCAVGARTGFEPAANRPGSGRIMDDSTASPVIAPDGSIFFGTYSRYNYAQGHLMKFSATGEYLGAYLFGYDDTPAIYRHDGTYSVITQDNHFGGVGSYCNNPAFCPPVRTAASPEAYYVTQLSADLVPEWRYRNVNTNICSRGTDGLVTCSPGDPNGFELSVNAPLVDGNGVVYATSVDGNLYVVNQGGGLRTSVFLDTTLGAAPTPISINGTGELFVQNAGILFVVGRH